MWDEAFLKRTIEEWQPCSKEPLKLQDAQEIAENVAGLLQVLGRIDRRIRQAMALTEASYES
ncbi:MAG: hypothetical protein HYZ73_08790 [Elusimicrobia bacterium]|nr:hypothetical protein [Elusimicrobiota bacterium]